jgi:hypothetical protein
MHLGRSSDPGNAGTFLSLVVLMRVDVRNGQRSSYPDHSQLAKVFPTSLCGEALYPGVRSTFTSQSGSTALLPGAASSDLSSQPPQLVVVQSRAVRAISRHTHDTTGYRLLHFPLLLFS